MNPTQSITLNTNNSQASSLPQQQQQNEQIRTARAVFSQLTVDTDLNTAPLITRVIPLDSPLSPSENNAMIISNTPSPVSSPVPSPAPRSYRQTSPEASPGCGYSWSDLGCGY